MCIAVKLNFSGTPFEFEVHVNIFKALVHTAKQT